jgi:hypothetical protein
MVARREPGTVTIRSLLGYRLVSAGVFLLLFPILIFGEGDALSGGLIATLLCLWLAAVAMQFWFGVDLRATDVVVNSIRYRRIPWGQIQAVTQESFMGGRPVVLWTVAGQSVPLRAPFVDFTGIGAETFERRFHVIGRWWLDRRGSTLADVAAPAV